MRNIQRMWAGTIVCSLIFFIGGCVHVVKLSNARVEPVANPASGPAVVVVKVTDARTFEAKPKDRESPTLEKSSDIANPDVTVRAIGRAKNNGHTFYFLYPNHEADTVKTAVRGAVENGLRDKGYVVVANDSPGATSAIPVEVTIRKFWVWWQPQVWVIEALYDVEVDVKSPVVLNGGTETVQGHHQIHSGYMTSAITRNCVRDGLKELAVNLQAKLKSP